jgi:hypothetical protein
MTRRIPVGFAAAVLLLAPVPGFAQRGGPLEDARQPAGVSGDGTEVFRWLLDRAGVTPVQPWELRDLDFGNVIVIVLGDPAPHRTIQWRSPEDWATHAVKRGGAALVATDSAHVFANEFPFSRDRRNRPYTVAGIKVQGDDRGYLGRPNCPFAVPRARPPAAGPEWGLFDGLTRVATNAPSFFTLPLPQAGAPHVLAGFPDGCSFVDAFREDDPADFPLAVGRSGSHPESGERYRFLALADSSVFINEMMVPVRPGDGPPDNLLFATRVVSFLSEEGGEQARKRCLFIQNGEVIGSFDDLNGLLRPPPPPIPLPSLDKLQPKLVDAGNQILDRLQTNNAHNTALLGRTPERQARRLRDVMTGLLVVVCIYSAWFVLRRVWGARQPTDVPPPPPGGKPPTAPGVPQPGVFDRRQQELLRRNNVYDPVRVAVREMFAAAGAPAAAGPKLPKVVISDVVRRPDTLRAALAELWKIGYGRPRAVTAQRWAVLEPLFGRARQAHADGKWRFVVDQQVGSGGEV